MFAKDPISDGIQSFIICGWFNQDSPVLSLPFFAVTDLGLVVYVANHAVR